MAEAGKPGPEHAKLQPLVGNWTYTCKFWMDPSQPPMESTGTIERKWVLGKRFVEEKVVGTNFDGTPGFEGVGLIGYDNGRKQYTSSWTCNMGTGTSTGLGEADASGHEVHAANGVLLSLAEEGHQGTRGDPHRRRGQDRRGVLCDRERQGSENDGARLHPQEVVVRRSEQARPRGLACLHLIRDDAGGCYGNR